MPSQPPEMKEQDEEMSDSAREGDVEKNRARLSKLERIKKKLRNRDSHLSMLVKDNTSSLLAGDVKPYESHNTTMEDGSKEAVRVLSYATFKLQRQVDKKTVEIQSLKRAISELEETLQEKEQEKSTLSVDMNIFRRSLEAYSEQIDRLSLELETKNKAMATLMKESNHQKQQAEEWKGRLEACHKDYEWMRKESMSKSEQLEYFEYELLSKNDEIDKLHQELDRMLRRIAELEVDMELMDVHSSRFFGKNQGGNDLNDSFRGITRARSVSFDDNNPAVERPVRQHPQVPKRNAIFRLRDLKCQSKAKDTEAAGMMMMEAGSVVESNNGSFPTDLSTDTTAILTHSTDASTPPRLRRSTGKKTGRSTKASQDQQYIDIIDNLRSDLIAIEAKYKQDKYNNTKLIEKLKQENNEYLIKIVCMDCKTTKNENIDASLSLLEDIRSNDDADCTSLFEGSAFSGETPGNSKASPPHLESPVPTTASKLPNRDKYLQKKVESLKGECQVRQRTIEELTSELSKVEIFSRNRQEANQRRIDDLVFQTKAMSLKISELENDSRFSRSMNRDRDHVSEYTSSLERKIEKQSADIENLHLQNELKDRTIEALRAQLAEQRVRQQYARGSEV